MTVERPRARTNRLIGSLGNEALTLLTAGSVDTIANILYEDLPLQHMVFTQCARHLPRVYDFASKFNRVLPLRFPHKTARGIKRLR